MDLLETRCADANKTAVSRLTEATLRETLRWLTQWRGFAGKTAGNRTVETVETVETVDGVIREWVERLTSPRCSVRWCYSRELREAMLEALVLASLRGMKDGEEWEGFARSPWIAVNGV